MEIGLIKLRINFNRIAGKKGYVALLYMLIIFLFTVNQAKAQSEKKIERWYLEARKLYMEENLKESVLLGKKVVLANPEFADAHLLLADAYNQLDSTEQEIRHLKIAREISPISLIIYRLGDAYLSESNYSEALIYYHEYSSLKSISDKRKKEVQRRINNCEFALKAIENPVKFNPVNLGENVNSNQDEYWPSLTIDGKRLVITRLLKEKETMPQEDFFISEFDSTEWSRAKPLDDINTKWNEGAQTISADGKILFFTACNRPSGKGSCDIYYSLFKNGKWSIPLNAGTMNSESWEGQPTFSSDNRYLYFTSSRENGLGNKDIWRAELLGFSKDGELEWGDPVNLGASINSPGDEISPFIHPNNKDLYFVSDFLTGMGGFDIFHSKMICDTVFSEPSNMGYPINTLQNEQGLIISADGQIAYFASERNKENGMDIFSFELDETTRPEPVTYAKVKVVDAQNKNPLQSQIALVNLTKEEVNGRTERTDLNGELLLCLPLGADYGFNVSKEGYLFYSQSFPMAETKSITEPFILTLELEPVKLGAKMNLYNIYFQTDSFTILPQSVPELQKLSDFLQNNPLLKVEIQGHTDSSGDSAHNQKLSEQRAQSVVAYLIDSGIEKHRMISKGFGDTNPIKTNETSEGRKLNRRTTIKIIGN